MPIGKEVVTTPAVSPTPPTSPPPAKASDTGIIGRRVDRWALVGVAVEKVTCTVLRAHSEDSEYIVVYADGAEEVLSLRELEDCWDAMTSKVRPVI